MILEVFRRNRRNTPGAAAVHGIYSAIVAEARQPVFYAEWGVPDTVTGRFDMISLHLALLFHRLRAERAATTFSQAVFDLFFHDMDRSLREMGVTDLGVPRKIQQMGNIFYGLLTAISESLANSDRAALQAALTRNIYGGEDSPGAEPLAEYLETRARELAAVPTAQILSGRLPRGALT